MLFITALGQQEQTGAVPGKLGCVVTLSEEATEWKGCRNHLDLNLNKGLGGQRQSDCVQSVILLTVSSSAKWKLLNSSL